MLLECCQYQCTLLPICTVATVQLLYAIPILTVTISVHTVTNMYGSHSSYCMRLEFLFTISISITVTDVTFSFRLFPFQCFSQQYLYPAVQTMQTTTSPVQTCYSHWHSIHLVLWAVKVKQSRNRPDVAYRVPGGLGSQTFMTFGTWRGEVISPTHRPPLPQECSWYSFSLGADSTPGPWCGRKEICHWKIQWPPGIDPGTVRLVAQRLSHYTTPVPLLSRTEVYKTLNISVSRLNPQIPDCLLYFYLCLRRQGPPP